MLFLSYTILSLPDLSADVCFSDHLKVQCLSTSHFSLPEPLGQFACGIYEISIGISFNKTVHPLKFCCLFGHYYDAQHSKPLSSE